MPETSPIYSCLLRDRIQTSFQILNVLTFIPPKINHRGVIFVVMKEIIFTIKDLLDCFWNQNVYQIVADGKFNL